MAAYSSMGLLIERKSVIRILGSPILTILPINPFSLVALEVTVLIWVFQLKSLEIITPRYL